jgi:hypothetical protein
MSLQSGRVRILVITIGVLLVAVLVVAGAGWAFHSTPGQLYTFAPCPGLTVTTADTTGIWNCPNEPVTVNNNTTFAAGQLVTVTGVWASGYSTLGCVPQTGESSCVVPQIAMIQGYLHANIDGDSWFVVQWKNSPSPQLGDGRTVTISGYVQPILYSTNPGATYPVYHINNQTGESNLLQPQPTYEIVNATIS